MDLGHGTGVTCAAGGGDLGAAPAAGPRGRDVNDGIVESDLLDVGLATLARALAGRRRKQLGDAAIF